MKRYAAFTLAFCLLWSIRAIAQYPVNYPRLIGVSSGGGSKNGGALFELKSDYTTYTSLHDFQSHEDGFSVAYQEMVEIGGVLYGTTANGGLYNRGVLFSYKAATGEYKAEYHFSDGTGALPSGNMILASDGKLYGLTQYGGLNTDGVVFSYDPASKVYEKKADLKKDVTGTAPTRGFSNGAGGSLFAFTAGATLDGSASIIEYNVGTGALSKRADFPAGSYPTGYITLAPNGKMYGFTITDGANNFGTLFEFDPATGAVVKKVDSDSGTSCFGGFVLGANGTLYGAGAMGVLEYAPGTTSVAVFGSSNFHDGHRPTGRLTAVNGKFYGLNSLGGPEDGGSLFVYDPVSHDYTHLRGLTTAHGREPDGTMTMAANGNLYGTTLFGGSHQVGVLFEYDIDDNIYTVKKNFQASETGLWGAAPLLRVDNKIYGNAGGGSFGYGVLYEYDLSSGTYSKKADVDKPAGWLIQGLGHANGKFYYATFIGDRTASVPPRILEFNPATGVTEVVSNLTSTTAQFMSSFVLARNGKIYGFASSTDFNLGGLLFEVDPVTRSTVVKLELSVGDGRQPYAVFEGPDGHLYGTAQLGGTSSNTNVSGTLFKYDIAQNTVSVLHNFIEESGAGPQGMLAFANGKIYGVTSLGGQFNKGTLYEFDLVNSAMAIKKHLEKPASATGLMVGFNGRITGAFAESTGGSLFEFDPSSDSFQVRLDFRPSTAHGFWPINMIFIKGEQTLTFPALGTKTVGSAPFSANAAATSGLPIAFTSSNPNVATAFENTVTIHGAGQTTITASQNGDDNYNAATPVSVTLIVSKGSQTITFSTVSTKTLSNPPFNLTAAASSNLPVLFTTTSDKVSIEGSQVTLLKAGSVAIKANQAGNANYTAATSVEQTFCINPDKPSIIVNPSIATSLSSTNPEGNQWFKDGTAITGATNVIYSVTTAGSYTVQTSIDGCKSIMSDASVVEITGLEDQLDNVISIFPNPATDEIFIKLDQSASSTAAVDVIDMLGRTIESRHVRFGVQERFDLVRLRKGVYLFKIEADGVVVTRKFVRY